MTILLLAGLALAAPKGTEPADDIDQAHLDTVYDARRLALVVGVSDYRSLPDLQFAAKDATDIGDVFADNDLGSFDEIIVLTDSDATQQAIRTAWGDLTDAVQADDLVLVYFSGHGSLGRENPDQLFVLPADARLDDLTGTGLAIEELRSWMRKLEARRLVMILDTCHSPMGDGVRASLDTDTDGYLRGLKGNPLQLPESSVGQSEAWMYAAAYMQPAREDPALQNGVYTHFLLQAMRGAADGANEDGEIDSAQRDSLIEASEAHNWVQERTYDFTGQAQLPRLETVQEGRERIYLTGTPPARQQREAAQRAWLADVPPGAEIRLEGETWDGSSIQPGVHRFEVDLLKGTSASGRVRLEPGETLDVQAFYDTHQQRWLLGGGVGVTADVAGEITAPWSRQFHLWGTLGAQMIGIQFSDAIGTTPEGQLWGAVQTARLKVHRDRLVGPVRLGPVLSAGGLWQIAVEGSLADATAFVSPSVMARMERWHLFIAAEPGIDMIFVSDELPFRLLPTFTFYGGTAF